MITKCHVMGIYNCIIQKFSGGSAADEIVNRLEKGMLNYSSVLTKFLGGDISQLPGIGVTGNGNSRWNGNSREWELSACRHVYVM